MLLETMRECNNFFVNEKQIEKGKFTIQDEVINLQNTYLEGQYIAVTGSILNNGIYFIEDDVYTLKTAVDEEFEGVIYGLIIPRDFLNLVKEVEEFQVKQGVPTNVISENLIGVLSYTKATDKNGQVATWQSVFKNRLAIYRTKMFTEINI